MKTLIRASLIAASVASLTLSSQAQVLTADTILGSDGTGTLLLNQTGYTQTFSNIGSIESLTFRFVAGVGAGVNTNIDYYFTQWAGTNAVADLSTGAQTLSLPGSSEWTNGGSYDYFDAAINLSMVTIPLNAASTYGLTFVGNIATDATVSLATANPAGYDDGLTVRTLPAVMGYGNLATNPGITLPSDFAFSASSVSPVPEASGVAVLFAGAFVGSLMLRRQRRQPTQLEA